MVKTYGEKALKKQEPVYRNLLKRVQHDDVFEEFNDMVKKQEQKEMEKMEKLGDLFDEDIYDL